MEPENYIINVGPNGTFKKSGNYQTLPEHIDDIFATYAANDVKSISIYFHGGLVKEAKGMKAAEKLAKEFCKINHAPIGFVWETGLLETLSTNIGKISETKLFDKLFKTLVKKLTKKLGFGEALGRGAGELSDDEIEEELAKEIPFANFTNLNLNESSRGRESLEALAAKSESNIQQTLEAEFTMLIQTDSEFKEALQKTRVTTEEKGKGQSRGLMTTAKVVKHVVSVGFRIIKRFIKKRDHDLYPTIIEEILREFYVAELGAWIWESMKDKSLEMWSSNAGRSGNKRYAGRYFLERLHTYCQSNDGVKVNLIGHSAGSIAICNMMSVMSQLDNNFTFNKIVFLAPACRVDLFYEEVIIKPERYQQFRMFTMLDAYETKDQLVKYLYTHSLLYLISGILENEGKSCDEYILGLERHINLEKPYHSDELLVATHEFLYEGGMDRVAFSVTSNASSEGMQTKSTNHSDFDDDPETLESITHFLNDIA